MQFLPTGWEDAAKRLGAMRRQRKLSSAGELLRILLVHIANGCSMRETVARAKQGGLAEISDVALLKRLKCSSEWLRWMAIKLISRRGVEMCPPKSFSGYNIKSVDASVITEPGSTGTDWRLHYAIELFTLQCDQFVISRPDLGESFVNFRVNEKDLFVGDRAYGRLKGFKYVVERNGYFLARLKSKAFNIYDRNEIELNLLNELRSLAIGEIRDIDVVASSNTNNELKLRLCALRKSDEEAEKSIQKAIKEHSKKQRIINPETIELHKYIVLGTSLPDSVSKWDIAELYRARWQIEIAFKRLKSIMGLGHLPKKDEESARAWLHGKKFIALLTQAIVDEGRFFSPWGYPIKYSVS